MRYCRHCGQPFMPAKPHYYWCCYPCRQADQAAGGYTAHDVTLAFDRGYQAGLVEGLTRQRLPLETWRQLLTLVHPDRHQGSPLERVAHAVTVWLTTHRPEG
jgi:hypothetical protein